MLLSVLCDGCVLVNWSYFYQFNDRCLYVEVVCEVIYIFNYFSWWHSCSVI